MSTEYIVQNNVKGYWSDWSRSNTLEKAVKLCVFKAEQKPVSIDMICGWRVIKIEIVQVHPQGIIHEQH